MHPGRIARLMLGRPGSRHRVRHPFRHTPAQDPSGLRHRRSLKPFGGDPPGHVQEPPGRALYTRHLGRCGPRCCPGHDTRSHRSARRLLAARLRFSRGRLRHRVSLHRHQQVGPQPSRPPSYRRHDQLHILVRGAFDHVHLAHRGPPQYPVLDHRLPGRNRLAPGKDSARRGRLRPCRRLSLLLRSQRPELWGKRTPSTSA